MKYALLFWMLFFSAPSHALSGNDLYGLFVSEDAIDMARGLGYIQSLSDAVSVASIFEKESAKNLGRPVNNSARACISSSVTYGQMRDVIVKYLKENPAKRDMNGYLLGFIAFREAWPCRD